MVESKVNRIKNWDTLTPRVVTFIAENSQNASIDGIANHFKFEQTSPEYTALKNLLADLAERGEIKRSGKGFYFVEQNLGPVILEAVKRKGAANDTFDFIPVSWPKNVSGIAHKPDTIRMQSDSALHISKIQDGGLYLARVSYDKHAHNGTTKAYKANVLESLDKELVGTLKIAGDGSYVVKPATRKRKYTLPVSGTYVREQNLKEGSLVRFNINPHKLENGCPRAFVTAAFGDSADYNKISQTVAMMHGLTPEFNSAVMDELNNLPKPSWANRTDLTHIPFVTIDDITTTDMDDAMYGEPDTDPKNPGGWNIIVAIADVAQYMRWDGEMDKEARKRGNTTYLPGFRCDMIPNELASDLCSLVPNEKRSCLAISMKINAKGKLIGKEIQRGIMVSRAKLHHKQVEAAMAGKIDAEIAPHMDQVRALYDAYKPMARAARHRRQLPIESKEQKIAFDAKGNFDKIEMRPYMDINRVIEQWMVLANVAAAQLLKERRYPGIYRTHADPSEKGVMKGSTVLGGLGYSIDPDAPLKMQLVHILEKSKGKEEQDLVHMAVIRMLARAEYLPDNDVGHFGLALDDYAHFTSPIRRYADVMVHRFLISAYKLGDDGLRPNFNHDTLMQICGRISSTERQSQQAETDVRQRFNAVWAEKEIIAAAKEGKDRHYRATITDIRDDGLVVEIKENGVQGFIPVESLPGNGDYVMLEEFSAFGAREAMLPGPDGVTTYRELAFQRGASLNIQIVSADPLENSILFKPSHNVCAIISKYRDGIMAAIDKQFNRREFKDDFNTNGSGKVSKRQARRERAMARRNEDRDDAPKTSQPQGKRRGQANDNERNFRRDGKKNKDRSKGHSPRR